MEELKTKVISEIDTSRDQLVELARKIHAYPELGFHEELAVEWLTEYLKDSGFSIERGVGGLATAFRAGYGNGQPVIALLAEYDALPEMGHACGHNLIAAVAAGAGVAVRTAIDKFGGSIVVIGTPAEELYGGKVFMADKGAFDNLDAAIIVHPGTCDMATTRALACQGITVEFEGKAAHAASSPEEGVNALEAMLLSFSAINSLRQHIRNTARIHGIINHGGMAANIVPAYSAGNFLVRAADDSYLDELKEKVLNCFKAAATASGAKLKCTWDEARYAPMRNNLTLARMYVDNMQWLGRKVDICNPDKMVGSTDMGNVSQLVPSIHPHVRIAGEEILIHSPEFALAADSEMGMQGMLDAAKAVAMMVVDLLASPETLVKVREEFEKGSLDAGSPC